MGESMREETRRDETRRGDGEDLLVRDATALAEIELADSGTFGEMSPRELSRTERQITSIKVFKSQGLHPVQSSLLTRTARRVTKVPFVLQQQGEAVSIRRSKQGNRRDSKRVIAAAEPSTPPTSCFSSRGSATIANVFSYFLPSCAAYPCRY